MEKKNYGYIDMLFGSFEHKIEERRYKSFINVGLGTARENMDYETTSCILKS